MLRPRRIHLPPPVSYQGGKRRQAPEIVRHMAVDPEMPFYDLCCGSGAVSLELISRGHDPAKITMVDAGPWGDVWRLVGAGEFDVNRLEHYAASVPDQTAETADALVTLRDSVAPDHPDAPYVFLLLQSGSFGGKAIGVRGPKWWGHSFRRDLCRPLLLPSPHALVRRMRSICKRSAGVTGIRGCISRVDVPHGAVSYLDPPYEGTAGYGHETDAILWAAARYTPVYVSELRPLSLTYRQLRPRVTSNLSARSGAKPDRAEYLSLFNADWPTPDYERAEQITLF